MNSLENEHKFDIKYLYNTGLTPENIHADSPATFVNGAPALSTEQTWVDEVRNGWDSLELQNALKLPPPR